MQKNFVDISFPLPLKQLFTYKLPEDLREQARIGSRVTAPFGPRKLTGFIVRIKDVTDVTELKEIQDVLDFQPPISKEILDLATWISNYYFCSLGEALRATIPASFLKASKSYVKIITDNAESIATTLQSSAPRQAQILRYMAKRQTISLPQLKRKLGARRLLSSLSHLEERGLLQMTQVLPNSKPQPKIEKYVRLNADYFTKHEIADSIANLKTRAPKQAQCLLYLKQSGQEVTRKEVLQKTRSGLESLRSLADKGLIEMAEKVVVRDYYDKESLLPLPSIRLNQEQTAVLQQINAALAKKSFEPFLLFGVTGSGKTQVYIEAIYEVLKQGRDAIVLVPEISLTPQTVKRFRTHFKDKVAVLHSAMSDGERFDSWRLLKSGKARVAIGPRSAVFAPVKNLGLIVVDEEHEGSYKQADSTPRYHARDVAVVRAKQANAVIILGSATPSTESFYNAQKGKYSLLKLQRRVNNVPLPDVQILDMLKEKRLSGKKTVPVFSRLLTQKINEKLTRNEQIILLINRRGFSSYIKCQDCGYIETCKNCNISLTYHLHGRRLRCHYCGYTKRAPEICPDCQNTDIIFRGTGTQKVEEEIKNKFHEARVVRMDLDTTGRKWAHDRILKEFEHGKYDILLGTQMVAKGLDFNRVTLVGVINADVGLLIPDFRASERIFQLLTQVAGRAGRRNLPGEVIIQTYSPDHFSLLCAQKHDFLKYFAWENQCRQELLYPPYGRMVHILFKGKEEKKVMLAAYHFAKIVKKQSGAFQVLGPIPSPISKIQNKFRYQILLKEDKRLDIAGKKIHHAVEIADELFRKQHGAKDVRVTIDMDPISIV